MALGRMLRKEAIDIIYTSDLKKATKTTQEISKYHPNVTVVKDKKLREQV